MFVAFSDPIFHSVFAIDFLPGLSFGCSFIKVHEGIFHNQLFWNSTLNFFLRFPSQAIECFLQVLVLDTFFQWALSFFLYVRKICMFVAISDPIFIVFFAIDFLPGLNFGYVTNPSIPFLQILRITASFGADFCFAVFKVSVCVIMIKLLHLVKKLNI